MSGEELGGVLVAAQDVEVVSINLDVSTNWEVGRRDKDRILINILVLSSLQEWSLDDTGILLSWLED